MSDVSDVRKRSLEERRKWSMWGSGEPRREMCRQMAEIRLQMGTEERFFLSRKRSAEARSSCDDGGTLQWRTQMAERRPVGAAENECLEWTFVLRVHTRNPGVARIQPGAKKSQIRIGYRAAFVNANLYRHLQSRGQS